LTLGHQVFDLGTGLVSEPVYGYQEYYVTHGRRLGIYRSYGVVGTETRSYHEGYRHVLNFSAWQSDASQPAGRRVLWEGRAEVVDDQPDPRPTTPYLLAALVHFYGQATDKPTSITIHPKDALLTAGRNVPAPASQPARSLPRPNP